MATHTEKEVSSPATPPESGKTSLKGRVIYFYHNDHLATEFSVTTTRSILWSDDIALAQLDEAKACALFEVDPANSVLRICSESMAYSPYGHHAAAHSEVLLAFNGERHDIETAGYYLGNGKRMYRPALLRFSSPDAYSPFDKGGLNPYAYCEADPINRTDPSGHFIKWIREVFAPKPPRFKTISQLIEGEHSTVAIAQNLPLQNFAPPSYATATATHGNPFMQPPPYLGIPSVGQQTIQINLGRALKPISSSEVYPRSRTLLDKRELYQKFIPATAKENREIMKTLQKTERELLIVHHERMLGIRLGFK